MNRLCEIPELPMQPPEPETVCRCAYCGDEIYAGNLVYRCDEGTVHADCVLQHIHDNMSRREIATSCGYLEGIA